MMLIMVLVAFLLLQSCVSVTSNEKDKADTSLLSAEEISSLLADSTVSYLDKNNKVTSKQYFGSQVMGASGRAWYRVDSYQFFAGRTDNETNREMRDHLARRSGLWYARQDLDHGILLVETRPLGFNFETEEIEFGPEDSSFSWTIKKSAANKYIFTAYNKWTGKYMEKMGTVSSGDTFGFMKIVNSHFSLPNKGVVARDEFCSRYEQVIGLAHGAKGNLLLRENVGRKMAQLREYMHGRVIKGRVPIEKIDQVAGTPGKGYINGSLGLCPYRSMDSLISAPFRVAYSERTATALAVPVGQQVNMSARIRWVDAPRPALVNVQFYQ